MIQIKVEYKNGDRFVCDFPKEIVYDSLLTITDSTKCNKGKVWKDDGTTAD